MLVQNVSKRNFVLKINGEIQTIVPNTLVDVDEELATDLIENYCNEWKQVVLPETATKDNGQKAEKVVKEKVDVIKKRK